jgi:hypothetical protein
MNAGCNPLRPALDGDRYHPISTHGGRMSGFTTGSVSVVRYLRKLHGGSQPILAVASDGHLYVVKFTNNLQGANLPFNESVGSELYGTFGLAGPAWTPLVVTDSFLDQNPGCWMQTEEGVLRPAAGLCFGSRFLGEGSRRRLEILPGTSFKRVTNHMSFWLAWLIDICARHADNRQAIFLQNQKGEFKAYFIDHGHLFGGPSGELKKHFLASRYLDLRIYGNVSSPYLLDLPRAVLDMDADRLWTRISSLPEEWKSASTFDGFAQCLDRLSNANLLQNIVDTMVAVYFRTDELELGKSRHARGLPAEVLCIGVPASGLGCALVGNCADHCACA